MTERRDKESAGDHHLREWFVRRGAVVKGPYPTTRIQAALGSGKLKGTDELSPDRESWRVPADWPAFAPQVDALVAQRRSSRAGEEHSAVVDARERKHRSDEASVDLSDQRRRRRGDKSRKSHYEERGDSPEKSSSLAIIVGVGGIVVALAGLANWQSQLLDSTRIAPPDCKAAVVARGNYTGCDLTAVTLSGAALTGIRLDSAQLAEADLSGAVLTGANLAYATLNDAVLDQAVLKSANLKGATLTGASLRGAMLVDADLSWATLTDADLAGATLDGACLDHATFPDGTRCAEGSRGTCVAETK